MYAFDKPTYVPIQQQNLFSITGSCRVRDKATKQYVPCEFPFKFKGKIHHGCIDYIDIKNGQKVPGNPWCSTKVRGSDRIHVNGGSHYGDCNSSCPGVDEGSKTTTTKRPTFPPTKRSTLPPIIHIGISTSKS